MKKTGKIKWWQGSWTIPLSIMLHVLIGTTYILWSGYTPAPAQPEPESVSVEMVEPPKEEPPPKPEEKKPEEKKAEEPPPPAEEKPQEPPPPQMPPVAIRPGPTQLDERDEPGAQEAGGQEQKTPEKAEETPRPATPPEPSETKEEPVASEAEANADQGEMPASPTPVPDNMASVAIPLPKPEVMPKPQEPVKAPPDGESNSNLKPAKKIISAAKRPGPMLRQIMGELPPRDRVAQLCVAEAMAQIKESRGFYEGLKPHTGRNFPVAGDVMNAQGAFNVGTQWYPINYRCKVDIDNYIVTDFNFAIGPKLSTDDIKRLRLPSR